MSEWLTANWPLMTVLLLAFLVFAALALHSTASFSADDENHYLIARYSWRHPGLFLDLWGRPAYTLLSSPFAQLGIRGAGFFNILVCVLSCYVAFEIGRTLGLARPWVAAAFTAVQPFFVQLSYGTLTEPLFALLLAASVLFYLRNDFLKSALCMSLLPLARLEGFAFLGLWTCLLAWRREWKAAACLLVFPLAVNTVGFLMTDAPWFFWRYNPYGTITGAHPQPRPWAWLDYVVRSPVILGPALLPLVTFGLSWSGGTRRWFVSAVAACFTLLYFVAYSRGIMGGFMGGSVNDSFVLRFFVGGAPLLGVLAAHGVDYLFVEPHSRTRRLVIVALAIVQAVVFTFWWRMPESELGRVHLMMTWLVAVAAGLVMLSGPRVRPLLGTGVVAVALVTAVVYLVRWVPSPDPGPATMIVADTAQWFQSSEWKGRPVVAMSPDFWINTGLDPFSMNFAPGYKIFGRTNLDLVRSAVRGTIIVWDPHRFYDVTVDEFSPGQFRRIYSLSTSDDPKDRYFHRGHAPFRVVVFEKVS